MIIFVVTGLALSAHAANYSHDDFYPPENSQFDWIQLTSDEWLKGNLKALYDYKLEFDSDKLELLTFDFEDVKEIRTHRPFSVRIEDKNNSAKPIDLNGFVRLSGNKVIIISNGASRQFPRNQLVSIAQSGQKEIDLWSGDVTLGTNIKKGNTQSVDFSLLAHAKRRTASSRIKLDYVGNYTKADNTETANSHRLSGLRDSFISKELFWRQIFAEFYRDPFKNIETQISVYTSLGYHLVYTPETEWDVSAGGGVRETRYTSVEPGDAISNTSPAFGAGTTYDTELTKTIDLLIDYNFQLVNDKAGTYTHHFITTLETDLTGDIDLDLSFIWDRIEHPQADSDGIIPDKDDYQLIVGLGIEF